MSFEIIWLLMNFQVELSRIAGTFPQDRICEAASDSSRDSRYDDETPDSSTQQVFFIQIENREFDNVKFTTFL